MRLQARPATAEDPCAPLLLDSARPYYTAYAGSEARALALLEGAFAQPRHAASHDCTTAAFVDGELVGVVAGFPVAIADELSRRFVRLTLPKLPPWTWPRTFRHLSAAGRVAPAPPADAFYVDALAVAPDWRRRGVARRLLDLAHEQARAAGLHRIALDTGLQNLGARALYEGYGFAEREIRRAPDARTASALGGPGFVGYLKAV
jgi:ribosomal protein S18 acetylase RimI-like enzyme